jgi:hypothetical protein
VASVPDAGAGAIYTWTVSGGTITSGADTRSIGYTAGDSGTAQLNVTVSSAAGCEALSSKTVTVAASASLSIADVTVAEGDSGTSNALLTVSLSEAFTCPVTVNYATADGTAAAGSDYVASTGNVTFLPGQTQQTITVQVKGDTLNEPNETFFVRLSGANNAAIAVSQAVVTIVDDDAMPALCIRDASVVEGNNGTSEAVFTVSLSAPSGLPGDGEFCLWRRDSDGWRRLCAGQRHGGIQSGRWVGAGTRAGLKHRQCWASK